MNSKTDERARSYPVKIEYDEEDKLYIAEFLDLPGCSAPGATVEEAYERAQEVQKEWMRLAVEQGLPIPEPSRTEEYSGRILLRLPVGLHGTLAYRAKTQATSLNQYAVHLLSGAVVGDSISSQIEQLQVKVLSLERQLGQAVRDIQVSHVEISRQVAGTIGTESIFLPPTQKTGGSAYAAVGGSASQSDRIH